ncbi:DNA primase [Aquabacterium lacunae]|uniref:DNA primase n=1 Tax=Aquabacterium lacunae TaxID=2528630 RepID=A0A4Q9H4Q3_9BURK|nr:DNA primase [Aquabacterium lacunae]TBO32400.1 DNA primase [Aquabacterium lacunae]
MIPPSFIQDLLARSDIVDVVGRHVTLKKAGINHKGLCPFHGEKSPSFIVSPSRQTYHCFGCGAHGNAIGFLMEHLGVGFIDAVRDLAQIQGMPVPEEKGDPAEREKAKQIREKQQTLTDVLGKACTHWRGQLKQNRRAIDYLKGRGLTGEIAARFGLGYAPDGWKGLASAFPKYDDPLLVESGLVIVPDDQPADATEARRYDRFRDRIMFPIRNVQGEVIGFGGRVLDKGEPKYLNSPETPVFHKGKELYGLYEARSALRNKGYVLVTEGYMDVVALAQWGFANAVATLGTACTADHVAKLFRFTEQVVFGFDGDAAGRRAAGRALEAALPHATDTRRISFLFLPPEHDPDSFIREHGPEAFEAQVKQAVPLSRQLLSHAAHDSDLDSAEGRVKLVAQALPLIALLPEGGLQGQILQDLAQQARADLDDLRKRLAQVVQAAHGGGRGGDAPRRARPSGAGAGADAAYGEAPPFDDAEINAMASFHGGGDIDWQPPSGEAGDGSPHHPGQNRWSGGRSERGGWSGPRGEGQGSWKKGPWAGGDRGGKGRWRQGGGWDREARQEMRPLPQAARPLERAAWMLLHRSELWEQLPPELCDLLCDQPLPLGAWFRWLDRQIIDEGPLPAADLLTRLTEGVRESPDEAELASVDEPLQKLAQRLQGFHDMGELPAKASDLVALIRPMQLQALNDELDLLLQSGELSETAEQRKLELFRLTRDLKLEISRSRPISA